MAIRVWYNAKSLGPVYCKHCGQYDKGKDVCSMRSCRMAEIEQNYPALMATRAGRRRLRKLGFLPTEYAL